MLYEQHLVLFYGSSQASKPIPKMNNNKIKQITQAQQLPQQQGRFRYPLPRNTGLRPGPGPGRIMGLPLPRLIQITNYT